ncbi:MAG: AraC family transcriptional regulator ligand-binding domain-containing protein [Verrucomicrobiota bacterium]
MSDGLRSSNSWGKRFADRKIAPPALLCRAGLSPMLFEQEKVFLTTAQLFALWRGVGKMSSDPAIGLKLGGETRLARSHPAGIAVLCSRTFEDALPNPFCGTAGWNWSLCVAHRGFGAHWG